MFGKKPQQVDTSESEKKAMSVETIPASFYGGNDPVIYHDPEPVTPRAPVAAPPVAARLIAQPPVQQPAQGIAQPPRSGSHKPFFIVVSLLVLVVGGGAAWYFLGQKEDGSEIVFEPAPPEVFEPAPVIVEPEPDIVLSTTTPESEEVPVSLNPVPLDFPKILLADAEDQDADSLTDSEEELFGTDSGIWDSDQDGYYDGQELFNLYNPKGFAPVKLIDSGLVKEYANPTWQYRLYYPASWEIGNVDAESNQVLISSIAGDYIEVRAMPKQGAETFFDWFARVAGSEFITDLQQNKNRFEEGFWVRKDALVAYVDQPSVVYVVLYHPKADGPITHRHVMQMALQSFRPSKTSVVLPEQTILPKPAGDSSAPVKVMPDVPSDASMPSTSTEQNG